MRISDWSSDVCSSDLAVKCVPPENKPTPAETKTCMGAFLEKEIAAMTSLKAMLALGQIAHVAVLDALKVNRSAAPSGPGVENRSEERSVGKEWGSTCTTRGSPDP